MTVESASYISQLDTTLPTASNLISEGDDHLRLTKTVLKTQFPNFGTTAITASAVEVNYCVGVTSAIQTQIDSKGAIAGQAWTGAHSFAGATSVPTLAAGSNTTGAASTAFVQADFLQKFPNYTAPVNASTAELNYLVGLTGAIQPQLSNQVSAPINAATAKATPADADELGITDSAASWGLKKLTFANLKAWISSLGGAGISNTPSGNIQATNVQAAINELDSEKVSKTGDNITGSLNVSGSILSTGGAIGYSTGAGGTVTQATSKTTGVTINKPSGSIRMHNAALAAGASVVFSVLNSTAAGHGVVVSGEYSSVDPSNYRIELAYSGAVGFAIRVTNITAGSLSQALEINFCVLARSFT